MRTVISGFAAVLLAAQAACAASILYATAASTNGIDGFCIRPGGWLASAPKVHVSTDGVQPRRLLVKKDPSGIGTMLYVAERDRIQAFPIGAGGVLRRPTSTKVNPKLDPRDLALSPDGKTLYATHRSFVAAYQLDPDGGLPEEFTSCVQGVDSANYLDLQVANGLLYVSADGVPGRIEVYRLNPDGSISPDPGDAVAPPAPETGCGPAGKKGRPKPLKWPYSERTRIQKPKAFVVAGDMIYVEERARRRLIAFRLQPDGTFCDKKVNRTDRNDILAEDCTGFDQLGTPRCKRKQARKQLRNEQGQQCTASTTGRVLQYEGLTLHPNGETLIGAQFFKGRVDSYRLQPWPDPRLPPVPRVRLPKHPTVQSKQDPAMTPVRLAVEGNTVYVAAGELDRVVAYHLTPTGVLADPEPFSRTDEQKDSFPNDVAVSMLSAPCE